MNILYLKWKINDLNLQSKEIFIRKDHCHIVWKQRLSQASTFDFRLICVDIYSQWEFGEIIVLCNLSHSWMITTLNAQNIHYNNHLKMRLIRLFSSFSFGFHFEFENLNDCENEYILKFSVHVQMSMRPVLWMK